MQISAEIRWFWREEDAVLTTAAEQWFSQPRDGIKPGGGKQRDDVYLIPSGPNRLELGIKRRGQKPGCEVKGLIAYSTPIWGAPFQGEVELWGKWSSPGLTMEKESSIKIEKMRRLRKLDFDNERVQEIELDADEKPIDAARRLPTLGCNIEYTQVVVHGSERWRTVGFEAFGPVSTVERILHRAVLLFTHGAPDLRAAATLSYPAWLEHLSHRGARSE